MATILERYATFANLRGIRMLLNYHPDPVRCMTDKNYMQDSQWRNGLRQLADYHFSFDVQIYDHQIDDVVELAQNFPNINLEVPNQVHAMIDRFLLLSELKQW